MLFLIKIGTSELTEEKSVQAVKHTNGKYLQENKEKVRKERVVCLNQRLSHCHF